MQLVFMGTPSFAVPSLEALYEAEDLHIQAVVTQPDRRSGRGHGLRPSAVKKAAQQREIPIIQMDDVNCGSLKRDLQELETEALVVVAFGQLLKEDLLYLPQYGTINLHASLLPKYRGAAPIQWALIHGEQETGVTTILLDEGVDSGHILLQERTLIEEGETAGELHNRLATIGAGLLLKTLRSLKEKRITPKPQSEERVTYAPMLDPRDGLIDWSQKSWKIQHLIQGTTPYPGAYTYHKKRRVKILKSRPLEGDGKEYSPGRLLSLEGEELLCATGEGFLAIHLLQPAGKRPMNGRDFFHGYCCKEGDRLGS